MPLLPLLLAAFPALFNSDFYIASTPRPMAVQCSVRADPDFRNFNYTLGPLDRRAERIPLRDGRYDEIDFGSLDWQTLMQPVQTVDYGRIRVWLVVLERNHAAGTGFFRHAFVFQCQHGRLIRLFQTGGEGVSKIALTKNGFGFERGIWLEKDAHASPSMRQTFTYRWDARKGRYELSGKTQPRPLP